MFRKNVLNKQENEILLREIYRNHFSFFAENDPSRRFATFSSNIRGKIFSNFRRRIVGEVISL